MHINFYHLTALPVEKGLPRLLQKVHQSGARVLVLAPDEERLDVLNQQMWSYTTKYFLPHGAKKDGHSERQPIFLSVEQENPNNATVLAMVEGAEATSFDGFEKALYMFDGADDAQVKAARTRWKAYKDQGHDLTYWQQTKKGGWEQAA